MWTPVGLLSILTAMPFTLISTVVVVVVVVVVLVIVVVVVE